MTVYEKLLSVQNKLKAPKNQYNKFGGYYYRNCEDILEAVKPILLETKTTLLLNDEVVLIGNRFYLKATAIFIDVVDGTKIECSAYANESEPHKGMTAEQVTGAASSYARKYALNALFCIDDTKDADSDEQPKPAQPTPTQPKLPYPPTSVIAEINACKKIPDIAAVLRKYQQTYDNEQLSKAASERKQQLLAIESIPESLDSLPDFLQ